MSYSSDLHGRTDRCFRQNESSSGSENPPSIPSVFYCDRLNETYLSPSDG
ncbi:hypothetical protein [Egbenema bharatensis]